MNRHEIASFGVPELHDRRPGTSHLVGDPNRLQTRGPSKGPTHQFDGEKMVPLQELPNELEVERAGGEVRRD